MNRGAKIALSFAAGNWSVTVSYPVGTSGSTLKAPTLREMLA